MKNVSEFNRGAAYCRDCIIANIIGLKNEVGLDESNEQYQILQKLLVHIEETYGGCCRDFKG